MPFDKLSRFITPVDRQRLQMPRVDHPSSPAPALTHIEGMLQVLAKLRSTPTVHPAHVRRREPKLGLVARSTDVSRQVAPRTQRLQRGQPLNASHLVK
ncbi:TPA: hypothetical protein ACGJRU_006358 [Pseudomonas aeruginosa]|uniref:Uncharacterized protein n=1 Tax=Stutzerimonas stutzeri TaxID=316 RepID=A0ABD4XVL8_STUST|nr:MULTISPECIES: hypothetical protein [Pseudomonadaceae]MBN0175229.1 hypothetical protein [Pseudomonas aeruginosa]MBZ3679477.1 hypothetical protein [Pseudomonas aeruginosa]MBZ3690878.1 hypothetical protein [Pseudomonas aeruginosa]MDH0686900.1 hypothetical protein [Stutzerimonas stutzeri]NRF47418.1 hypothetical protein [Stutzerimonas stutzeri]